MKKAVLIGFAVSMILVGAAIFVFYLSYANKQFGEKLKFYSMYSGVQEVSTAMADGQEYLLTRSNTAELCEIITRGSLYTRKIRLWKPKLEGREIEIWFGSSIHVLVQEDSSKEDTCLLAYTDHGKTSYCTVSKLKTFQLIQETINNHNIPVEQLSDAFDRELISERAQDFSDTMSKDGFYNAIDQFGAGELKDTSLKNRQRIASIYQSILLCGKLGESSVDYITGYDSGEYALVRMRMESSSGPFSFLLLVDAEGNICSFSLGV